jgi:flagellar assembly factor FliW
MNTAEPVPAEATPTTSTNQISLPLGLLGFEPVKHFALLADPAEKPFAWLKAEGDTALAFVVIDPFVVMPDYKPEIPDADASYLGIKEPGDALLLGIVTIHGTSRATMNLKGPVVINRHSHVGKQVIIANSADYSVHHPLPVTA